MQTLGQVKDLVQVKDVTQISARGLNGENLTELKAFLARMGVADAQITHPTTTLEDLFIRVVKENTPAGQTSVGSGG
jgi:ABC-2 type transport system ATP-binding protein